MSDTIWLLVCFVFFFAGIIIGYLACDSLGDGSSDWVDDNDGDDE